jgi:hypothetical protein
MSDKLKFDDIKHLHSINNVDDELVLDLINSIMERGWQGCPILIYNGELLTGSHRLIALKNIAVLNPNEKVLQEYVALDVTDIVNRRILELSDDEFEYGIDYSDLGLLFEGTEIEKYKDEIKEW